MKIKSLLKPKFDKRVETVRKYIASYLANKRAEKELSELKPTVEEFLHEFYPDGATFECDDGTAHLMTRKSTSVQNTEQLIELLKNYRLDRFIVTSVDLTALLKSAEYADLSSRARKELEACIARSESTFAKISERKADKRDNPDPGSRWAKVKRTKKL